MRVPPAFGEVLKRAAHADDMASGQNAEQLFHSVAISDDGRQRGILSG